MVDKYLYPGTNVLINKLNIKDGLKLEKAEYTYVSLNISAIINNPIEIKSLFSIFVKYISYYLVIYMIGQETIELLIFIKKSQFFRDYLLNIVNIKT